VHLDVPSREHLYFPEHQLVVIEVELDPVTTTVGALGGFALLAASR
jgi:hypothetical protein